MIDQEKRRLRNVRWGKWRKARDRDGRLNPEEMKAKQVVDQHYRWRKWYEKKQRATAYERAVRRDGLLNSEERLAIRRLRKNEQLHQWTIRNPDRWRQHRKRATAMYYGRRRNAPGHASTNQVAARWAYYADKCWMCRQPATQNDHVIPLSRGGSNWPANIRPACGPCNREKWDRSPLELSVSMP